MGTTGHELGSIEDLRVQLEEAEARRRSYLAKALEVQDDVRALTKRIERLPCDADRTVPELVAHLFWVHDLDINGDLHNMKRLTKYHEEVMK